MREFGQSLAGADLVLDHHRYLLYELGKQPGTLALIFGKAQNKFQDPGNVRRVIVRLPGRRRGSFDDERRREGRRLRGPGGAQRQYLSTSVQGVDIVLALTGRKQLV